MNVTDKVNDLIAKFEPRVYPYLGSGMLTNEPDENVIMINAIAQSVICVDEILSVIPMYKGDLNPDWKFWSEVKQELKERSEHYI